MKKTPDLSNYQILIAEDQEINYEFLRLLLEKAGAQVHWARNGQEAVEKFEKMPQIHLILMDIRMPKMNGYLATKRIREINAEIPIIAQTAYATDEDYKKAMESGCNDFIAKPIRSKILFDKLSQYLGY